MTTTPSSPLPQTCAPPSHPSYPLSVLQSGTRSPKPMPGSLQPILPPANPRQPATSPEQPDLRPTRSTSSQLFPGQPGPRQLAARSGALGPQGHQVTDQAYPSPLLQAHQTPAPSNLTSGQPVLPQPGHRTASLTRPSSRLFTDTDISSVAYKTPCNFYREGTILPVFMALPVFALPVNTNIPGTLNCSPLVGLRNQTPTNGECFYESTKFSVRGTTRTARWPIRARLGFCGCGKSDWGPARPGS